MHILQSWLFSQELKRGVFRLRGEDNLSKLKQQSEDNDYQYIELDGSSISSKVELLNALENALKPTLSFRKNWDAFEDVMESLEWITSAGVTIVYKDFEVFQKTNPKDFAIFRDIIYTVIHLQMYSPRLASAGFYFVFQSDDYPDLPPMQLPVPALLFRF